MSIASLLQRPIQPLINIKEEGISREQVAGFLKALSLPVIGLVVFLFLWQSASNNIVTSLGNMMGKSDRYCSG